MHALIQPAKNPAQVKFRKDFADKYAETTLLKGVKLNA
jgi:hypothetical protein